MKSQLKRTFRNVAFRSSLIQFIIGIYFSLRTGDKWYKLNHLKLIQTNPLTGAPQRDEGLFLFALTRMIRPRLILEFGFGKGYSSLNFLKAADPDCNVISYDISESAAAIAQSAMKGFKNFSFKGKSALEISSDDLGHIAPDLVFWDAIYDPVINMQLFARIQPLLHDNTIIVLHDTGTWARIHMGPYHHRYAKNAEGNWLNAELFQQQKGQRKFVNEFIEKFPEYGILHLHTSMCIRSGFSLVQKKTRLELGA